LQEQHSESFKFGQHLLGLLPRVIPWFEIQPRFVEQKTFLY